MTDFYDKLHVELALRAQALHEVGTDNEEGINHYYEEFVRDDIRNGVSLRLFKSNKTALGRNCVSGATSGNLLSDDSMKKRSIWKNIQDCIILKSKSCRYQNITSGAWKFGGMCMGVAAALAVSTCLSPLSIILYRYFWNWFCDLRTIWNDRKV